MWWYKWFKIYLHCIKILVQTFSTCHVIRWHESTFSQVKYLLNMRMLYTKSGNLGRLVPDKQMAYMSKPGKQHFYHCITFFFQFLFYYTSQDFVIAVCKLYMDEKLTPLRHYATWYVNVWRITYDAVEFSTLLIFCAICE